MLRSQGMNRFTPVHTKAALALGGVTLDERWALAHVAENSDLIRLPDGREFLIVPAPAEVVDMLAAYGADGEDVEEEGEALDWMRGRPIQTASGWAYPVIIQDCDLEPLQFDGGSR